MASVEVARPEEEFVCVAVFEFGDGTTEAQELLRGTEAEVDRFSRYLESARSRRRGIIYRGNRLDPLHVVVATKRLADEEAE